MRLRGRQDSFERTITVLKARGMPDETALRAFSIGAEGPFVA